MKVNKMAVLKGVALALVLVVLAMAVAKWGPTKKEGTEILGAESDVVQSNGYNAEKANGATKDEIVDLANRLAAVASIRYTGWTEDSEALIDGTLYGVSVPEIKETLRRGLQDREIALTEAFREVYGLLANAEGVGMAEEPGEGTLEYAETPVQTAEVPEVAPEGAQEGNPEDEVEAEPTPTPDQMSVDEFLESKGWHLDEEGHAVDEYGNPAMPGMNIGFGPSFTNDTENEISIDGETVQTEETKNSTLKEDGSIYTYEEWLKRCADGQVENMDGRIEWRDGTPYLKLSSAAASTDGNVSLLISGVISKVYVGVDGGLRGLVDDHAYDFWAFNFGFYEDGQLVVALQTKEFVQGEGEDSETCSGIYKSLLRGDVIKDNGVYKFQPSESAAMYLVQSYEQ